MKHWRVWATIRRGVAAVVALALAGTLLVAAPAAGEKAVHRGDPYTLMGIVLKHTQTHVVIRAKVRYPWIRDSLDIWVDTPRKKRRFHARVRPEASHGPVRLVRGFRTTGKKACRRWHARWEIRSPTVMVARIPRSCLGRPGKVRASVRFTMIGASGWGRFWEPQRRGFTRWVRAG